MLYKSPFTDEIVINSRREAYQAVTQFCNHCKKDAVAQFYCSGADSAICGAIQDRIAKDWSKNG